MQDIYSRLTFWLSSVTNIKVVKTIVNFLTRFFDFKIKI